MFNIYFAVLTVIYICTALYKGRNYFSSKNISSVTLTTPPPPHYYRFRNNFLLIYFLAMGADWMQGPYVYQLYSYYGFNRYENGILFIAGFGSALIFGTWVGPFADMCGRKAACQVYCIIYILSCATKHFNIFPLLLLGRLLGGIATSLLWSVFESWMISAYQSYAFDNNIIGNIFSYMSTGNGIIAVISGLLAQWATDTFQHPVAPFDFSIILLIICFIIIMFTWKENYGGSNNINILQQMKEAIHVVRNDKRILFTGIQQSLFESAMYTFIFLWTPSLEINGNVPHGIVFSCFMISVSLGGMLFQLLSVEFIISFMPYLYILATVTMLVPFFFSHVAFMKMLAFIIFEVIVGFFWPCIATLRAVCVPEDYRASVMNLFRVPLNTIVCFILCFQGNVSLENLFLLCALLHSAASLSAVLLQSIWKKYNLEL